MNYRTVITIKNKIVLSILIHCALFSLIIADEVCEIKFDSLQNYSTDRIGTLKIPSTVNSINPVMKHCAPVFTLDENSKDSPEAISLFFIIDHSGSMSVMDSMCLRYDAVSQLIDSINYYSPESEVGLVIFSNQLLHSTENDSHAEKLDSSSNYTDAFIPLTPLTSFVNGRPAQEYLKSQLLYSNTELDAGGNKKLINAYYGNSGRHSGHSGYENVLTGYNGTTDISLAFEAARKAFQRSKFPTSRQFIIFLSDGLPQYVDYERMDKIDDYVNGTGLPAIFTIYLSSPSSMPIPMQLETMIQNFQVNEYSSRNKYSVITQFSEGTKDIIVDKLKYVATGRRFHDIHSIPREMCINDKCATKCDSVNAYFDLPIILNSLQTQLNVTMGVYFPFPVAKDSTIKYTVNLQHSNNAQLPQTIQSSCRTQVSCLTGREKQSENRKNKCMNFLVVQNNSSVQIGMYGLNGRKIATVTEGIFQKGEHAIELNRNFANIPCILKIKINNEERVMYSYTIK